MKKFDLKNNETIILNSENVYLGKTNGELFLTNLSLIFVSTKGLFSKTYVNQRFPINQIRNFNGKVSVILGKNGELDIYFDHSQETVRFWNNETMFREKKAEKEAAKWLDVITQLVADEDSIMVDSSTGTATSAEILADGLKDTVEYAKDIFGFKTKSTAKTMKIKAEPKIGGKCRFCGASIVGVKGKLVRCQYCDGDQEL